MLIQKPPSAPQPTATRGRSWWAHAACAGSDVDPNIFFPPRGKGRGDEYTSAAKRVCARCPVRRSCLEAALEGHEKFGIWGGKHARERSRDASPASDFVGTTYTAPT
ncbi:WhiB family transcriptional regulator [Streptomyces chryseus]